MIDGFKLVGYSSDIDDFLESTKEYDKARFPARLLVKSSKKNKAKYNQSKSDFKDKPLIVKRPPVASNVKPGEYTCGYCEVPLTSANYTKEHIVPRSRGGKNGTGNLRPCCIFCNTEKGNFMLHTYIQILNLKWVDSVTGSVEYLLLKTKIKNANKLAKDLSIC